MVTSVQSVRRNTKTEKYPSTKNKINKGLCVRRTKEKGQLSVRFCPLFSLQPQSTNSEFLSCNWLMRYL